MLANAGWLAICYRSARDDVWIFTMFEPGGGGGLRSSAGPTVGACDNNNRGNRSGAGHVDWAREPRRVAAV